MTINKFNYEAFALDYLEGTLSPEMAEEMVLFLKTHPAIESELSGMTELVILEADERVVYEHKKALLKSERVVWLQKRWIRPLMAAASVALLLMTYFMGYQAGVNNGEGQVIVENSNKESLVAIKEIDSIEKLTTKIADKTISTEIAKKNSITNSKDKAKVIYKPIEQLLILEEKESIVVNELRDYRLQNSYFDN